MNAAPRYFSRELITVVEEQPVGRVVGGKGQERIFGVRTATDDLSIAAILRRQHLLLLPSVVVAVRPPVVPALLKAEELLGR